MVWHFPKKREIEGLAGQEENLPQQIAKPVAARSEPLTVSAAAASPPHHGDNDSLLPWCPRCDRTNQILLYHQLTALRGERNKEASTLQAAPPPKKTNRRLLRDSEGKDERQRGIVAALFISIKCVRGLLGWLSMDAVALTHSREFIKSEQLLSNLYTDCTLRWPLLSPWLDAGDCVKTDWEHRPTLPFQLHRVPSSQWSKSLF